MISFQYAFRDEFLEKSIQLGKLKKDNIKYSKEFILWAETKIETLHEWLRTYDFENENEEIEFFKEIKPGIISKLIFQKEILRMAINIPSGKKLSLKFYEEELKKAAINFNVDSKFYSYFRSESNEFDDFYFTRKNKKSLLETDSSQIGFDPKISTCYDNKIAVILAHDLLIIYIEKRIRKIKNKIKDRKKIKSNSLNSQSRLQWTRNKSELIELVYALYFSRVINNGNSDLKEIAKEIGKSFNLDIRDSLYRTYKDIKNRKNPTSKFIQGLADIYQKKLEEENN